MYLREGGGYRPLLDLRLDEPTLLRKWFLNLPIGKMNELWHLDEELGSTWYGHFSERVLHQNYTQGRMGPNGQMIGGTIAPQSLSATSRKWDEWMASSIEPASFGDVRLKQFSVFGLNPLPALLLSPDVYCYECDESEPLWLFAGNGRSDSEVHENYKMMVTDVLNHGLFAVRPEQEKCPSCHPETRYVTQSFMIYARHRLGMCECMPCRRIL